MSTPVLADIVRAALGPSAEVWSVVPVNGDPHTYEATARELERVGASDLYVYMGANLERYEESGAWRRAVQDAHVPVLRLADHLELITKDLVIDHGDHVHDLRAGDPHVWLDPAYARRIAVLARDSVIDLDPAGRPAYETAAAAYDAELARLEADLEHGVAAIPPEHRRLVVLHDAYTYFAARFGFEVIGYVTRDPGQEASAADVAALVRIVRETGVPAVFAEPQLDSSVLDMVAAETGVAVGDLLTDSFTADVGTYLDLMRYDLAELTRLLGASGEP
ncbi:MAG: zinc ABC transporter substrate-binding protein [Chloroflexi bacterium]|nr:zinc ABC transporter substrate-binding protein [Chloroflexota bacterium]